jgi:hypothetical protein
MRLVLSFLLIQMIWSPCDRALFAQSAAVKYVKHWQGSDGVPWYGDGTISAISPVGQHSSVGLSLRVYLNAHPNSQSAAQNPDAEWQWGAQSVWDASMQDANLQWQSNGSIQVPDFKDNPNGYLDVTVKLPLTGAAPSQPRNFEVYGTRDGLNVSPKPFHVSLTKAMIAIPGAVQWTTDSSGFITACTVTFGQIRQAKGLLGNPSFPSRHSPRIGTLVSYGGLPICHFNGKSTGPLGVPAARRSCNCQFSSRGRSR